MNRFLHSRHLLAFAAVAGLASAGWAAPGAFPDGALDALLRVEAAGEGFRVTDDLEGGGAPQYVAPVDLQGSAPEVREALPAIAGGADVHGEGPGIAWLSGRVRQGSFRIEYLGEAELRNFSAAVKGLEAQLAYCQYVADGNPSDLAVFLIRKSLAGLAQAAQSWRSLAPLPPLRDRCSELARRALALHKELEDR
jgi:hypothetical protein